MIFPRRLAVRILTRVLNDHQALDECLAEQADLSAAEMAWLHEICSGTLRWKGRLDWILDSISVKKKPSGWLRKILLLAAYQLVAQDRTPAAVVVSETVSEIKSKEGQAPAHYANACLRKVADHAAEWRGLPFPGPKSERKEGGRSGNHREQAAWASMPEWLWNRLVEDHGLEWAKSYSLASLDRPKLWLRDLRQVGLVEGSSASFKASPQTAPQSSPLTQGLEAGPVPGAWLMASGGLVMDRAGFREGAWMVQDISSQLLIHEVVGRVKKEWAAERGLEGRLALDLCAAPGGKAVGLAWNGFQVTATDRVEGRIPLLNQTVTRVCGGSGAPMKIQVVPWDSLDRSQSYDLVWVDAPCSGTGILRRHPDVRWLRNERELTGLVGTQRAILREAWAQVKSGGFLVYSVCSVLNEEGPGAVHDASLESFALQRWFLCPQESPYGDGFWATLLWKKPSSS